MLCNAATHGQCAAGDKRLDATLNAGEHPHETAHLAREENGGQERNRREGILPVREVERLAVDRLERRLDQHRVDRDHRGGEHAEDHAEHGRLWASHQRGACAPARGRPADERRGDERVGEAPGDETARSDGTPGGLLARHERLEHHGHGEREPPCDLEIRRVDELEAVNVEGEADDVGGAHGRDGQDGRGAPAGRGELELVIRGEEGEEREAHDGDDELEEEEGEGQGGRVEHPFVAVVSVGKEVR